jgi:3',5'-cyclic AMP phosphodiesterase CpdA
MKRCNRRTFLKVIGASIGMGTLYAVRPALGADEEGKELLRLLGRANGEEFAPFSFVQLSDAHVGFSGPPNPLGTVAFERAVEVINGLEQRPDLVLFTGDLTHDTEAPGEHAERMRLFQKIAGRIEVPLVKCVPGEHDTGLDGGELYRSVFGPTYYSFDHRGVHFIALDNVSRAKPEVGPEQIAWLKKDISRFPKTAPIVVFTHRPLFDLKPEWEWFTDDGDEVLNLLAPYQNVTVLYGHIHRHDEREIHHTRHYAARSLIFGFPDPESDVEKKPLPFDKEHPFQNLGIRLVQEKSATALEVNDVELTVQEHSGINGIQHISKPIRF